MRSLGCYEILLDRKAYISLLKLCFALKRTQDIVSYSDALIHIDSISDEFIKERFKDLL